MAAEIYETSFQPTGYQRKDTPGRQQQIIDEFQFFNYKNYYNFKYISREWSTRKSAIFWTALISRYWNLGQKDSLR